MKFVKYTLISLLLLIVVVLAAGWLYLEPLVKGSVHKFGTQVVGTEVNLGGFALRPLSGEVEISDLTVANPEGYTTPYLLSLGNVFVKVDLESLLSNTIVVEEVRVFKPEIAYEMPNFATSNVMQIQENVAKNTAAKPSAEAVDNKVEEQPAAAEQKPEKNVIIKKVLIDGGTLSAVTPLQAKQALVLSMPAIELTGIGENGRKTSIRESVTLIFNKILFNATSVVTKALGNMSEMAQKAAQEAVDQAKTAAKDAAKTEVEGLLDKVKFW